MANSGGSFSSTKGVDEIQRPAAEFYVKIGARIFDPWSYQRHRERSPIPCPETGKKRENLKLSTTKKTNYKLSVGKVRKKRKRRAEKGKSPFWPSIRLLHANLPVYSVVFNFFNVACC